MAAGTVSKTVVKPTTSRKTVSQTLTAVSDVTDWIPCIGDIALQVTGTSTAVSGVVERSTLNPAVSSNAAPLSSDSITGNPATGINVSMYYEPGIAWWRFRIVSMTGANLVVSFSTTGD